MLNIILSFLRNHRLILALAFLLTLIIKAPLFAFPFVAGDAYQGINIYHFSNLAVDEDFYLSRGKEVLEGHALGNPLIREGKEIFPDYYFNITEQVLVKPWYLLGLGDSIDIVTLYAVYNTVGVFALILLLYFFALRLRPDKLFAATVAVFVVGGYFVVDNRTFFEPVFNMYGRSLYPYIGSLAFFGYLILCMRALQTPTRIRLAFAGIAFGVLSYVYSYAWTFALLFNGSLFLICAFRRDWRTTKHVFLISCIGVLMGAYNVVRTVQFLASPAGQQFLYFYGAHYGRTLAYSKLGPLILTLFGLFVYFFERGAVREKEVGAASGSIPRRIIGENGSAETHQSSPVSEVPPRGEVPDSVPSWAVVYALLLAGWFALNQQFITGMNVQPNHYLWYYSSPALIIAFSYGCFAVIGKKQLRSIVFGLAITVFLLNAAGEHYNAFVSTLSERLAEQTYAPALTFLAKETVPGVVLAADDSPELLITVYTPHNVLWQRNLAELNDNPISRHQDALLIYLFLNREARRDPAAYLRRILEEKDNHSSYKNIYTDIEGYLSGLSRSEYDSWSRQGSEDFVKYRTALIGLLIERYDALLKNPRGFEELLTQYGVNWVLWDANRQPEWDVSGLQGLQEVASTSNIFLFARPQ